MSAATQSLSHSGFAAAAAVETNDTSVLQWSWSDVYINAYDAYVRLYVYS